MAAYVATPGAASAVPASATRRRRAVVWTLLVAASVIGFVSILTTWVNRQMLDQHSWTTASEELIQDPAVQDALSVFLVNQLYANVNVEQQLKQKLPPDTKQLAGPVAGAL